MSLFRAGNDHYTCTHCDTIFQYPNPLKSHMKFHCPAVTSSTFSASPRSTTRQRLAPSIVSPSSPSSSSRTSPTGGSMWDYHHPALHPFGIMSPMFHRSTASLPLPSPPWRTSWNSFLHPSIGIAAAAAAFTGYFSSNGVPYSQMPGCSSPLVDSESLRNVFYNTLTNQVDDFASEHRPSRSSDNRRSTFPVPPSASSSSCLAAPPPIGHSASDYFRRLFALQMSALRAVGSPANTFDDDPFRAVIGKPLDDDVIDHVPTVDDYDTEVSELSSSTYHAPEDLSTRSSAASSISGNYDSPITSLETFSSSYQLHRGTGNSTAISHQYGHKSSHHRHKFAEFTSLYPSSSRRKNDKVALSPSSVANGDEAVAEVCGDDIKSSMVSSGGGYKCPYCGKLYSRKYGLKIHVRTHTGFKPLQCRVCRRPFGDPSNLNKHVRLHAVHLQQASTTSASSLTSAAMSVTSSSRLSYCGGDELDLMRAAASSSPYACKHCGKVLVRRRDLERHIRSRHQEHQDADMLQSTDDMQPLAVTSSQYTSTVEMSG